MYYIRGMWRAATEDLSPGKIFVPYLIFSVICFIGGIIGVANGQSWSAWLFLPMLICIIGVAVADGQSWSAWLFLPMLILVGGLLALASIGEIVFSFVPWLAKAHRTISTKADRIREEDAVGGKKKYNFWKALSTDDHE